MVSFAFQNINIPSLSEWMKAAVEAVGNCGSGNGDAAKPHERCIVGRERERGEGSVMQRPKVRQVTSHPGGHVLRGWSVSLVCSSPRTHRRSTDQQGVPVKGGESNQRGPTRRDRGQESGEDKVRNPAKANYKVGRQVKEEKREIPRPVECVMIVVVADLV